MLPGQGIFHLDLWMGGKNVASRTVSLGIEEPLVLTSINLAHIKRSLSARAHVYIFSLSLPLSSTHVHNVTFPQFYPMPFFYFSIQHKGNA